MTVGLSCYFRKNGIPLAVVRHYSRNVLKLGERGLYQDMFPANASREIVDLLNAKPQCIYAGFDPTADSLHVGHLLVLMGLLHWQRGGHDVIAVIGSATGQVGDPSGRSSERPELGRSLVVHNATELRKNIQSILNNHREFLWTDQTKPLGKFKLLDNGKWMSEMSAIDFVSNLGRNFRLGAMLSRDSVKSRLASESGASLAELCYQAFQAYDWLYLYREYGCRFQLGGADQMGNIVSGHDLVSRVEDICVYGLTVPLVTSESGDKLGKSAGNAVWLSKNRGSPFELYQYFMRTTDADVLRLLRLFSFDGDGELRDLLARHTQDPGRRMAQRHLAEAATVLVFGKKGLEEALSTTEALYGGSLEALARLSPKDAAAALRGAPICQLPLEPGLTVMDLAMRVKCFATPDDASRIMAAGGFHLNHQKVHNPSEVLTKAVHILPNNLSLLRVGKKNYYVVQWLG